MPSKLRDRAKEAVANCLKRHLILPTIYFDAPWPDDDHSVDLLALDWAGAGDVHVIQIREEAQEALDTIAALMEVPAHFRWIAFFSDTFDEPSYQRLMVDDLLYPSRGMGRVGAIEVVRMAGGDFGANIKLNAQRFAGSYYRMADEFSSRHEADIQHR